MTEVEFWRYRAALDVLALEEKERRTFTEDDVIYVAAALLLPISKARIAIKMKSQISR